MPDSALSRFDSAALERVLQRAAELQTAERDVTGSLSGDEVLALGREVGIPERYLRQAMLEVGADMSRPVEPESFLDQVVGVGEVAAHRVVRGDPRHLETALVRYMDVEEAMRVLRHTEGHISWERIGGWQGAMRRVGSRAFMLQNVDRIAATVSPMEPGLVHVTLQAGIRQQRTAYLGGSAALASIGVAGTTVLAALGALWPLLLIPVPATLIASWAIARQYRPIVERTQLGLECALDHLERGAAQPSHQLPRAAGLLDTLIAELGGRPKGREARLKP